jgi:hypothetical protein
MGAPFIGSEVVAAGDLTPYELRTRFKAIHRDVYLAPGIELTAVVRAHAVWLWSQRRGVVAGHSASALHGARWVDANRPAELIYENRHAPSMIRTWSDRIEDDEADSFGGVKVTNPARTALDLGCRYPIDRSVPAIDALARATDLKMADAGLLAARYIGRRGSGVRVSQSSIWAGSESNWQSSTTATTTGPTVGNSTKTSGGPKP